MTTAREDPIFRGVGVALVTIFDHNERVDAAATADLAAKLVEAGISSVLVAGSTGEASALSDDDRSTLIAAVRKAAPDTVLLAGTGAPSAVQAIERGRAAVGEGADALLVLSPPGSSDVSPYYERVSAAATAPVLAYHYPAASSPGIPVEALGGLPVAGLKDSSGDSARLFQELDEFSGWLYTGSANLVGLAGAHACAGAILAIANVRPEAAVRAFAGDVTAQRTLAAEARRILVRRPYGLKNAVADRFGTSRVCRMG